MRTSITHPLQIAEVAAPGGGLIGVTFCPGKYQPAAATGSWLRDLGLDVAAIQSWGASAVVTLVTDEELYPSGEGRLAGLRRLAMLSS